MDSMNVLPTCGSGMPSAIKVMTRDWAAAVADLHDMADLAECVRKRET
jgi:hypothetical protein